MRNLVVLGMLVAVGVSPAMAELITIADGQITLTLSSDVSADPGADFYWYFSVKNETSYFFYPTGIDTDILGGVVTTDLADFNAAYPTDGVAPGEESAVYKIGYYTIPSGASGGAIFGPGTVFIYFDLLRAEPPEYVPGEGEFTAESVFVTGEPPAVPEPSTWLLCLAGAVALAVHKRKRRLPGAC